MKITNHRISSKRKTLAIAATVLLLLAITLVALEKLHVIDFVKQSPNSTAPTESELKEAQKADQDKKKDFIESPDPTPQSPPAQSDATIDLSARQESNGSVTVLTKLYSTPDGSCTLTVTNGNNSYTQSADVIYQPSFSSCAGFSVTKEKLGAGEWNIRLSVASDTTHEKTITFRVN